MRLVKNIVPNEWDRHLHSKIDMWVLHRWHVQSVNRSPIQLILSGGTKHELEFQAQSGCLRLMLLDLPSPRGGYQCGGAPPYFGEIGKPLVRSCIT